LIEAYSSPCFLETILSVLLYINIETKKNEKGIVLLLDPSVYPEFSSTDAPSLLEYSSEKLLSAFASKNNLPSPYRAIDRTFRAVFLMA